MRLVGGLIVVVMLAGACTGGSAAVDPTTTTQAATTTTALETTTTTELLGGPIGIVGLEELRLVSSLSVGQLIDSERPDAVFQQGLDGSGDEALESRPDLRFFTGDDSDIVVNVVSPEESATLNPNGEMFVFEVDGLLLLDPTYNKIQGSADRLSWNVMQRGLAGNQGGQWKLSLVNEADGSVNAQCVVRDEENRFMRVNSNVALLPNVASRVSCIVDDAMNELRIAVDGMPAGTTTRVRKAVGGVEEVVDEEFGDSNPNGGATCAGLLEDGIGNIISVGNKPACGATLTDDDRFQGEVAFARIWR